MKIHHCFIHVFVCCIMRNSVLFPLVIRSLIQQYQHGRRWFWCRSNLSRSLSRSADFWLINLGRFKFAKVAASLADDKLFFIWIWSKYTSCLDLHIPNRQCLEWDRSCLSWSVFTHCTRTLVQNVYVTFVSCHFQNLHSLYIDIQPWIRLVHDACVFAVGDGHGWSTWLVVRQCLHPTLM